jgi:hypothetical protein
MLCSTEKLLGRVWMFLEQEPISAENPLIGMKNVILTHPIQRFFGKESLEAQHKNRS